MLTQYNKLIVALLAAALSVIVAANGHFSQVAVVNLVFAVVGGAAVYFGPEVDGGRWTKTILAALTAAGALLATFVAVGGIQHVTGAEWMQIVFAVVGALGVGIVPNAAPAGTTAGSKS